MAAVNYYLGFKRGATAASPTISIVTGTSSAGTAVDVEVRIQINDGTNATNITRKDVNILLDGIESFINSGGLNHAGANLPAL
jgi:hypothetical protein